jgi:Ca-activated chloride channel family protein
MTDLLKLTTAADRSLACAEGNSRRYIVATIEACKASPALNDRREPVHLALVIDASGSMAGEKLEYAKAAAIGVAEKLRPEDRLSVVSFGSGVIVHADGLALDSENLEAIKSAISRMRTLGMTNLSAGWFTGAECLAKRLQEGGVNRIVLLSDGLANEGITDPEQLARHATELAERGIVTSTVGIGNGYNEDLLQAIADRGGGRLHDAGERGREIADVLVGELGEIGRAAARDVAVTLSVPATARAEFVGSAPSTLGVGSLTVMAGTLLAGQPRHLVFRITLPSGRVNETLLFGATARGTHPTTGAALEAAPTEVAFKFAVDVVNRRQPRDETASLIVARAWHASIVRTAADMNRGGDRGRARNYVERELRSFQRYCHGLPPEARELTRDIEVLAQNIDRSWDERTRKEMKMASYIAESNRDDYRSDSRAPWTDRLGWKEPT